MEQSSITLELAGNENVKEPTKFQGGIFKFTHNWQNKWKMLG